MVEEHDADVAGVVLVDDAGADVDEVLGGEAGARCDAAVGAVRDADLEVGLGDGLALRGDGEVVGGVEVVAGRELGAWNSTYLQILQRMVENYDYVNRATSLRFTTDGRYP